MLKKRIDSPLELSGNVRRAMHTSYDCALYTIWILNVLNHMQRLTLQWLARRQRDFDSTANPILSSAMRLGDQPYSLASPSAACLCSVFAATTYIFHIRKHIYHNLYHTAIMAFGPDSGTTQLCRRISARQISGQNSRIWMYSVLCGTTSRRGQLSTSNSVHMHKYTSFHAQQLEIRERVRSQNPSQPWQGGRESEHSLTTPASWQSSGQI